MRRVDEQLGALTIMPWRDPVVERFGHDPLGEYVELFWLGVIGPTATWRVRRLAYVAVARPDGAAIDLATLAGSVGMGGANSPGLERALRRLVMFGLARREGATLAVRTVVPPLGLRHLCRLPAVVQSAHALWSENDPAPARETALGVFSDAAS